MSQKGGFCLQNFLLQGDGFLTCLPKKPMIYGSMKRQIISGQDPGDNGQTIITYTRVRNEVTWQQ